MSKFNIGDVVSVLNRNLKGEIIALSSFKATILDQYGFEEELLLNVLVKESKEADYEVSLKHINSAKREKQHDKYIKQCKKQIKRTVLEVDLHIHHLVADIRNMTNHDMVLLQIATVKQNLENVDRRQYSKIVFIHGKGSGKLKKELEFELRRNKINFQAASFRKYSSGALEILL